MDQGDTQGGGGGGVVPAAAVAREGGSAPAGTPPGPRRGVLGCAAILCGLGVVVVIVLVWTGTFPVRGGPGVSASGTHAAGGTASGPDAEVADAEKKLAKLQTELNQKLVPALAKLKSDREDVKAKLKAAGVADSKGLKENYRAQSLGQELAEVVGLIRVMEVKRAAYERSGFELESLVRRLKRKTVAENAGLTDQEMAEVTATLKTIDAQLADVTQAPPELNPAQFDALIDEELGAATLEGRIATQTESRQTRLDRLKARVAELRKASEDTDARIAEVENFRTRLDRAYRQALDEERWPIKVAGRSFDRVSAERAMTRATEYAAAQKGVPVAAAPLIQKLDEAVGSVEKEIAELRGLSERAKGMAMTDPRAAEIKTRVGAMADTAVDAAKDPLLTATAPGLEPFDPEGK